jgi:CDP-glycerol glycerophosphotransferase
MYAEHVTKYPELERMFRLYGMADRLISVSDRTNELNKDNLSPRYGLPEDKFQFCDNLSNPEEIIARSQESLEQASDETLFEGGSPIFINLARLSVEKDHEKLIRAFARFRQDNPSARLLILGSGPLEHHLHQVVRETGVEDCVHLLGYRKNPYPYLRKANCFVLSSNHEGQPMTLLEALVLDKPIVATDIVGNRSVLHDRPGLLVPNSEEGLIAGMAAFASGGVAAGGFDWRAYQVDAIEMFNQRVLGQTRATA